MTANRWFAARGWILAVALPVILIARAISNAPLRPPWLLLVVAGIILRGWAGAHLGTHGNAARAQAPDLATSGPYRFSRNPLYLSNTFVSTGIILYANASVLWISILLILAILLHHVILVRHEESVLAGIFGDRYDAYRHAVPRWIGFRCGEKQGRDAGGYSLRSMLVRQGRNIAYALASVLSVWVVAKWS
ncbi:MAG TPA: methyltransferase [Fibrobacteria bacterium]|nr:methyltransferase [Fibrobacteria bacterium]